MGGWKLKEDILLKIFLINEDLPLQLGHLFLRNKRARNRKISAIALKTKEEEIRVDEIWPLI
jgi:hypothetical protein